MVDILVTDDAETSRKLLRVILEEAGFGVAEAADGVQALEVLAHQPARLVLSDVLMPRMDGYRLCYEIRTRPEWRQPGIILYTGTYNSPADERLAFQLGANKYLKKPLENSQVVKAAREVLNGSPQVEARDLKGTDELLVMKEYSEVLVTKLETKNDELELARWELMRSNQQLRARTQELERARAELRQANQELERRVRERTAALENANRELESFSHSVSHDLRGPIRAIEGWTAILLGQCAGQLDPECRALVDHIPTATQRMKGLISDLLRLSQVTRVELRRVPVDLSRLASSVVEQLRQAEPDRPVEFIAPPALTREGDPELLRIVLANLLENAWKFTKGQPAPRVELGVCSQHPEHTCFIRDNGVGFDMAKAGRLFEPFQRLHSHGEFPGTGIGLATVRRIIERHGGRVWAESIPGQQTTFCFSLEPAGGASALHSSQR